MAKRSTANDRDDSRKQRRPLGWVGVVRKDGVPLPGFYFKAFDEALGRRVQKHGGESAEQAQAAMIEYLGGRRVDVRTGLVGLPDAKTGAGGRKVSEVVAEFLRVAGSRVSSDHVERLEAQLERFQKALGDPAIARVTRDVVEEYLTKLGRKDGQLRTRDVVGKGGIVEAEVYAPPMSPNTQRRHLSAIGSLFNFAADRRYVSTNPARGVRLKKVQQYEPYVFTGEQLLKLYGKLPPKIRGLCVFLGETGARLSEGLGLQWTAVADDFSAVTFTSTKNRENRRVPLTARAAALLRARHKSRVAPLKGPDYVFEQVSKNWAGKCFHLATAASGFPRTATIHGLRHSYAVGLTMAGTPFSVTCELLGHATPSFTADRYARWVPDGAAAHAVAALQAARAASAKPGRRKARKKSA